MYGVKVRQYSLDRNFEIPIAWKRWAYQQGYAPHQIEILGERFKKYYLKKLPGLQASELGWEQRFHKWVGTERQIAPLLKQEPEPQIDRQVGLQHLEQLKAMLKIV